MSEGRKVEKSGGWKIQVDGWKLKLRKSLYAA